MEWKIHFIFLKEVIEQSSIRNHVVYDLKYFFYAVDNSANEIYEMIEYFDFYFKDIFLLIKFRSLKDICSFL